MTATTNIQSALEPNQLPKRTIILHSFERLTKVLEKEITEFPSSISVGISLCDRTRDEPDTCITYARDFSLLMDEIDMMFKMLGGDDFRIEIPSLNLMVIMEHIKS